MPDRVDKPNLSFPLAASYNERGVRGFTNTVTNELDQRKVNLYYEVTKNSLTGEPNLTLALRPAVVDVGSAFGHTFQVSPLVTRPPGVSSSIADTEFWVFSTQSGEVRLATSSQFTTFQFGSNHRPTYVDRVSVNNVPMVVIQNANSDSPNAVIRSWYASTFSGLTEIVSTFTTFTHVGKMEFMDGFGFIGDRATNRIQNSNLNTISTWPSANFITKQITQDRFNGLAKWRDKLLAFGDETVEIFYNAGLSPAPLLPLKWMHERIGLASAILPPTSATTFTAQHYYATVGGRMYFPGTKGQGSQGRPGIMAFDGQRFERVSTPYIDKILQDATLNSVNAMEVNGQQAIAISIVASNLTTQRWLMFFPEWKDWFEWTSRIYSPINANGRHIGLGQNSDRLFQFNVAETFQDATSSYSWLTQFKLPPDGAHHRMSMFGVVADTARSTNNMNVAFSDDDGQSWVTSATIDLSQERKIAFRGGGYSDRFVRLSGTTSTEVRLHKFIARVI